MVAQDDNLLLFGRTSAAVVVRSGREHREELVLHAKGRLAPRLHLVGVGQGEAQLSQADERPGRHS